MARGKTDGAEPMSEVNARWQAYVAALNHAQATMKVEDAIAAGHAWRSFLDGFITTEQRHALRDPFTGRH